MAWLDGAKSDALFVSVLTLGELAKGIAMRAQTDAPAAASLEHWLGGITELFADRVIAVDAAVAVAWGRMSARGASPVIDTLLAATAQVHDLTLVTRNVRHIRDTGVSWLNPWDDGV